MNSRQSSVRNHIYEYTLLGLDGEIFYAKSIIGGAKPHNIPIIFCTQSSELDLYMQRKILHFFYTLQEISNHLDKLC